MAEGTKHPCGHVAGKSYIIHTIFRWSHNYGSMHLVEKQKIQQRRNRLKTRLANAIGYASITEAREDLLASMKSNDYAAHKLSALNWNNDSESRYIERIQKDYEGLIKELCNWRGKL